MKEKVDRIFKELNITIGEIILDMETATETFKRLKRIDKLKSIQEELWEINGEIKKIIEEEEQEWESS